MIKKINDEKLETERKNLDNLEIIESIKFREEKSSISRGKMKNKGYEDNIGVNFFLKRKQDEKGEDMEEDIER